MDYMGIVKRAWEITKKHRYLWIFGILAGGAGSGGFQQMGSIGNGLSGSSSDSSWVNNLGSNMSWENFLLNYYGLLIAIFLIILAIGFVWTILSITSQGALLGSVRLIAKNEKNNFRTGLAFGWQKFWRVFAVGLLIGLGILISIVILVLPIVLLVIAKIYVLAVIYGILFFLVDLVFWIYISFTSQYIFREAVLADLGAWQAILDSWNFIKKHLMNMLMVYVILLAIGIVVGIGMIFALLLVGGLLFAIGYGLYLASTIAVIIYGIVFGLIFVILMLVLGGVYTTFTSTVVTLAYLEMTKS